MQMERQIQAVNIISAKSINDLTRGQILNKNSPCFLNFISSQDGEFKQKWTAYQQWNQLYLVTMILEKANNCEQTYRNVKVIHSNSRKYTHMERILLTTKFGEKSLQVINKWPVFKQPKVMNEIPQQIFEIKFDRDVKVYIKQKWERRQIRMTATLQIDLHKMANAIRIRVSKEKEEHYFTYIDFSSDNGRTWKQIKGVQMYQINKEYYKKLKSQYQKLKNGLEQELKPYYEKEYKSYDEYIKAKAQIRAQRYKKQNQTFGEEHEKHFIDENEEKQREVRRSIEMQESLETLQKTHSYISCQFFVMRPVDPAITALKNSNKTKSLEKYNRKFVPLQTGLQFYTKQGKFKMSHFLAPIDQIVIKGNNILDSKYIFQSPDIDHICVILNHNGNMIPIQTNSNVLRAKNSKFAFLSTKLRALTSLPSKKTHKIMKQILIFEKCYAKIHGGFRNTENGEPGQVFMMLTNSCTTYYTHKQSKIYLEYMWLWRDEMLQIKRKRQENKVNNIHNNITSREYIKQDNHFITVTFGNVKEKLLNMFKGSVDCPLTKLICYQNQQTDKQQLQINLEKWIQTIINTVFSFRGIWKGTPRHGEGEDDATFIKLADMRGQKMPLQWRSRWTFKNNIMSKSIKQNRKQSVSINGLEQQIVFDNNQFLITLKELKQIKATVAVCLCKQKQIEQSEKSEPTIFQNYYYNSHQICFEKEQKQKDHGPVYLTLVNNEASQSWIALHEEHDKTKKSYGISSFQIQIEEASSRKKLKFLNRNELLNYSFFKFYFQKKKTYKLKINHSDFKEKVKFCYVSLLSKSKQNFIGQYIQHKSPLSGRVTQTHEQFEQYLQQWSPFLQRDKWRLNIHWTIPYQERHKNILRLSQHLVKILFKQKQIYIDRQYPQKQLQIVKDALDDLRLSGTYSYQVHCTTPNQRYMMYIMLNKPQLQKLTDGNSILISSEWVPISQMDPEDIIAPVTVQRSRSAIDRDIHPLNKQQSQ